MKKSTFKKRLLNLEKKYLDYCAKTHNYESNHYLWHESLSSGRIFFFEKSNAVIENCYYNGLTRYKAPTDYLNYLKSLFQDQKNRDLIALLQY